MGASNPRGTDLPLSACACRVVHDLIHSLQTSQDFLRRHSLCCRWWGGRSRSLSRLDREQRTESHALSRGPMTLIVLATAGLLACAFYIYVLSEWMRDANGKKTTGHPIAEQRDGPQGNKRPFIISTRKIAERDNSSDITSHRAPRMRGPSRRRGQSWNESERIAYQKIARSRSLRKKC